MTTIRTVALVAMVIACAIAPAVYADGEVCSASEKQVSDGMLRKAEDAERAGRMEEAYKAATQSIPSIHCAGNGYQRRDGLIERTSRKLGSEAEKAGRFGAAFEYYSAPERHGRLDYDLTDADRVMLAQARAKPDDYGVVSEAVSYFERRDDSSSEQALRGIAMRGGEKMLAKEEKAFVARKDSLAELQEARKWLELAGDAKAANARAEQRGDVLLAEGSFRSVERAFSYYEFAGNEKKTEAAKGRARSLGDQLAGEGDHGLAAKFYGLSGDEAKAAAVEERKEQVETERQDQFKKDQDSLEKELGL